MAILARRLEDSGGLAIRPFELLEITLEHLQLLGILNAVS